MIRINLLPHRQIKRAERQRQFNLMLVAAVVAAAAIVFMGQTIVNTRISVQAERNARLDAANAKLDKEIAEIKALKDQIRDVLDRKQVVENLQSNRSQAVVLMDEVTRQLPEGLYLKSIKQQENSISLEGVADTNARIATLVRNFSSSQWLESPSLIEIKSVALNNIKQNNFLLNVKLKVQQPVTPEDAKIKGR